MLWTAPRISIRLSPRVALTFYSRVTVSTALALKYPYDRRASTVALRYYFPGWFLHVTTYFRLLKSTVKNDIPQSTSCKWDD